MKTVLHPIIFTLLALTFSQCTTYDISSTRNGFLPIEEVDCKDKASGVYVSFENEPIDFEYTRIGYVYADEMKVDGEDLSLDLLKYRAWANCANGILFIKSNFKVDDVDSFSDADYDVNSHRVYEGMAVNITIDSAFVFKYGANDNLTFVTRIEGLQKKNCEEQNAGVLLIFVAMFAAVFYMAGLP